VWLRELLDFDLPPRLRWPGLYGSIELLWQCYGEHRRADAQTSCDSAGSSDPGHRRTQPLLITNKTRDAALGEPRIRAGEIIGWRFWKLSHGLLYSVFVSYTWHPGVFERSSSKHIGLKEPRVSRIQRRRAGRARGVLAPYISPAIIGSVAMWGEVIEHQHGWRSEYAAVRSITKITGDRDFSSKQQLLLALREKYGCALVTEL
jgi:hypothetical protein